MKYILGIDQSTSGTKVLLVDSEGRIRGKNNLAHFQKYPSPGWAEQDGEEIWQNVLTLVRELPTSLGIDWQDIQGFSISNQRETTLAWDKQTGEPLSPAITWQCQRGQVICDRLKDQADLIRIKTGLALSAYYPASKAAWLLENIPGLLDKVQLGQVCLGTIDSYLIYRLTNGAVFATDYSNASRTQLFNLDTLSWDEEICHWFNIPLSLLPKIVSSDEIFGYTADSLLPESLAISGVMGDSHAALFGQGCIRPGMAKATYGTGSSVMLNVGSSKVMPPPGICASLAFSFKGQIDYVLEGNVTSSGDTLNWLCDQLELVQSPAEIDALAEQIPSAEGVYVVPAFTGLGAPYFDSGAKAAILGLSRGSKKVHVARAALESIAFQNQKIVAAMGIPLTELKVDGGPTKSDVLMQFQADILQCNVRCSAVAELSALGSAYMCGLTLGLYSSLEQILHGQGKGKEFIPSQSQETVDQLIGGWDEAVSRVRSNIT